MNKRILILATSLFVVAVAWATSTYTTNFNLEKPGVGDTNWAGAINSNFDLIDTQMQLNKTTADNHIADAIGAHAATAISTTVGAEVCITADTVQEFLDCLDTNFNTLVGGGAVDITSEQTITGAKTFSSLLTTTGGISNAGGLTSSGTTTLSALGTGLVHSSSTGVLSSSLLVNADVSATADIARSKIIEGTANHVVINDSNGDLSSEAQLAASRGGTGINASTAASGELFIGNGAGLTKATLTGTTNQITVTNGAGSITLSTPQNIATSSSPTFVGATLSGLTASRPVVTNGSSALVSGSIDLADSTNDVTGTLAIPNGGTGQTSQTAAFDSLAPSTAKGDVIAHNGSDNVRVAVGANGTVLLADSAESAGVRFGSVTAIAEDYSSLIENLSFATSVGSSALTIDLKTRDAGDPTADDSIRVGFRNATLTTGTYEVVSITSALSLVISSGSTLGQVNSVEDFICLYLVNNSGTPLLAASGYCGFDEGSLHSTTAEGGAGAADASSTLYAASAVSNKAIRLIGRIRNTQTTAGTWASAGTELSILPFRTVPWFVDVNINGGNFDLGTSAVAAFTGMTNGSMTMTNNTSKGSDTSVQIGCSTTVSPSGLTCSSGTESNSVSFIPPNAGLFEACVEFGTSFSVTSEGAQAFRVVETAIDAQTVLQSGGATQNFNVTGAGGAPIKTCGTFAFSNTSRKMLRLFYRQRSGTGIGTSLVFADNGSIDRDVKWTVREIR